MQSNELRTTKYQLNTSDERQATCDEFALFCLFFALFCTFCASLWLTRTVFTRPKTSIISVNPVILSNFSPCSSWLYLLILAYLSCRSVKICVNPWLINNLRLFMALYNCKEDSTTIESSLQIKLFMQNKANFRKVKLNVNNVLTKDYDQLDTWSIRKNEPKTNPNEPKTNPIKANIMLKQTQTNPKQTQSPAGSSAARKKSISCARQLVRKYTVSAVKSYPKIAENTPSVEKTSHKEENKIKTRLIQGV